MEEEIEIRDSFTSDALDKTPTWLMKWGVIAVALTIITLLCLAAIMPYNQTIRFPVTVGNSNASYVVANTNGHVVANHVTGRQMINKGDTLLVLSTPGQTPGYIISPGTGFPVYENNSMINTTEVKTGDTLLKILPAIDTSKKIMVMGYSSDPIPNNLLHTGQATIRLSDATDFKGNIVYASIIPEPGKGHMVMMEPENSSLKNISGHLPLYSGMKAEATVILKKRTILQWIFD